MKHKLFNRNQPRTGSLYLAECFCRNRPLKNRDPLVRDTRRKGTHTLQGQKLDKAIQFLYRKRGTKVSTTTCIFRHVSLLHAFTT